ncbi:hypothetical protein ONA21_04685 [Mycoplasmopsis cynos]|nr:hypothetical protein [Mycoplasmopsis cynos]WAM08347.1 hypothetical protein ONA21_04685 [Mycoplasmopsis cynos]
MPGYGYARVSIAQAKNMMLMVEKYLETRQNLKNVYLLIDSRHGITKNDQKIIEYLLKINLSFILIYTKIDKLNQREKSKLLKGINESQKIYGKFKYFIISSETGFGINELIVNINETIQGDNYEK